MRLIDADRLIEAITINPVECPGCPEPEWAEDMVNLIDAMPSVQPEIVRCKDCVKHNKAISDTPYKEYVCPLVKFRGKAHGHEFDYQYCAYGKRNGESDGSD